LPSGHRGLSLLDITSGKVPNPLASTPYFGVHSLLPTTRDISLFTYHFCFCIYHGTDKMPQKSQSKRAKKLLNQLFEVQSYDFELTAPLCLETKFLLKNSRHCTVVEVTGAGLGYGAPKIPSTLIPRFILSQLEAQKLTRRRQPQIALTLLLDFVLSSLPAELSKANSSPTFFRWQCGESHRTYFIAAFITSNYGMSTGIYPIEALLRLRERHVPAALAALAEKDQDFGKLFTCHLIM
jgi:hypothetical protein